MVVADAPTRLCGFFWLVFVDPACRRRWSPRTPSFLSLFPFPTDCSGGETVTRQPGSLDEKLVPFSSRRESTKKWAMTDCYCSTRSNCRRTNFGVADETAQVAIDHTRTNTHEEVVSLIFPSTPPFIRQYVSQVRALSAASKPKICFRTISNRSMGHEGTSGGYLLPDAPHGTDR